MMFLTFTGICQLKNDDDSSADACYDYVGMPIGCAHGCRRRRRCPS